jgi:hypothetical protein
LQSWRQHSLASTVESASLVVYQATHPVQSECNDV